MAKYKLVAEAVIGDVLRQPGFEFEYDGVPGHHMEPLDAAAKRAAEERDKANEGRQSVGSPVGAAVHVDPPPLNPPELPKAEGPKEESKEEPHRTVPRDHDTIGGARRG